MAPQAPKGPYRLVTVNNAPDRAKRLIGRVVEDLKDVYTIDYVGNCIGIEEVEAKVRDLRPDILCCASMWTRAESEEMQAIARSIVPNIKTHAIPQGLQIYQGPDAVVAHLKQEIPKMLG